MYTELFLRKNVFYDNGPGACSIEYADDYIHAVRTEKTRNIHVFLKYPEVASGPRIGLLRWSHRMFSHLPPFFFPLYRHFVLFSAAALW